MRQQASTFLRGFAAAVAILTAAWASAAVDDPAISGWSGTAYHEGGWFTNNMAKPETALKFSSGFLLSPLYSAPIRKIAVVASRPEGGDRALGVAPLTNGVESAAQVRALASSDAVQLLDFDPSDGVAAFRMYAGSSGSGSWTVSRICVFYGEKAEGEDEAFSSLTGMLAAPENIRAESFSTSSLTVAADPVGGASGYVFEVSRVDGVPETTVREDFVNAPDLSNGWTFGLVNNAALSQYATASSVDIATASDGYGMQVDPSANARLEILSPEFPAAAREVSFFAKCTSSGASSDAVMLYGMSHGSDVWTPLMSDAFAVPSSKTQAYCTNAVDVAADIRQVKLVLSTGAGDLRKCVLDTLRVVYGGDETRTPVVDGSLTNGLPRLELSGLGTARYAFRAKAVGDGVGDSQWTAENLVDLAWAGVVATAPENVAVEASGGSLHVSWSASEGAAFYRVVAVSAEDSDVVVRQDTEGTNCALAVSAVGEYEVTVTAFSPGGMTSASAAAQSATVALGAVGAVSAAASDYGEITATWEAVPLAAGYSAKIFALSDGDAARVPAGNVYVTVPVAVFSGLDPAARYVVEVVPQPGDDASLGAASEAVDMSLVRFRRNGAAPLGHDGWSESFDALANMTKAADFKTVPLDYWQIAKGAAVQGRLNYTSGTNSTSGGVYAFSDEGRSLASFALGSLASGTDGCVFGIALVNASELAVDRGMTLSFDMVQRSYRANKAAYVLEWKMTDGETGILSDGGWTAVSIPDSAPYAAGDEGCPEGEYRQEAVSVELSLPSRLAPGGVLILRWRHPKTSSGPMMAIDNVRLSCSRVQQALRITVR